MYYTGKGDGGTTTLFGCSDRVSKQDPVFAALGTVDEFNCWIGLCSVHAKKNASKEISEDIYTILIRLQEQLFILQAELGGSDKKVTKGMTEELEAWIAELGPILIPRKSFTIPGGSELSAMLDIGRAMARRVERSVLAIKVTPEIQSFLNRLSSIMFVLARRVNDVLEIEERGPSYN